MIFDFEKYYIESNYEVDIKLLMGKIVFIVLRYFDVVVVWTTTQNDSKKVREGE
jgi:hypothetical protein